MNSPQPHVHTARGAQTLNHGKEKGGGTYKSAFGTLKGKKKNGCSEKYGIIRIAA
jgi:hypothetical protein